MTYYEDLSRAERLAIALKQVDRQSKMLHDLAVKAKAEYDERKAKYDALRVPQFTVDADGVHEVEVPE